MVRTTDRPIPLDQTGEKIEIPEPGPVTSLDMQKVLPSRLRDFHSEKACLGEPDQEALSEARKCVLVREGEYAQ